MLLLLFFCIWFEEFCLFFSVCYWLLFEDPGKRPILAFFELLMSLIDLDDGLKGGRLVTELLEELWLRFQP